MKKVEELTNAELDTLVIEKVMEWSVWERDGVWKPSTNIEHAFEVNKPGWRWKTWELLYDWKPWLLVELYNEHGKMIAKAEVDSIDVAAHCRGRCITALLACGVEEV